MDKRRSCANCSSTDHHVSACPTYKQGMKAIGFSLEDEDASELDHEDFMRGVIVKYGPRCSFATYYLTFCTKMVTKLVNDTQQSIVVVVEPLLDAPCIACRISLLPRPLRIELKSADPFRIERNLSLTCLNAQITLQYKPHKRATKLIVTILTDINACNNNISINNKRQGRITSCLGG